MGSHDSRQHPSGGFFTQSFSSLWMRRWATGVRLEVDVLAMVTNRVVVLAGSNFAFQGSSCITL